MLKYEDCKYALLYFTNDKTFEISPLSSSTWSRSVYTSYLKSPFEKTLIETMYGDENHESVIIQVASAENHLSASLNYVAKFKTAKKWSVSKMIRDLKSIPRFQAGKKGTPLIPLKVC